MHEVSTDQAPAHDLPFSQAIVHDDTVYVSGQVPVDPVEDRIVGGGIRVQTRQVMDNVAAILAAADTSLESVVKATVYLDDMGDFRAFNEVYREYVSEPFPARSAIAVDELAIDVAVELDVVAAVE